MMHRTVTLNRVGSVAMGAVLAVGLIPMTPPHSPTASALFARHLVLRAWQRGEYAVLPHWPDTEAYPVARLTSDALDDEVFIVTGHDQGNTTFGLNHLAASVLPGDTGNSVIAASCDTQARFLADTGLGDRFVIDRKDGARAVFEVVALDVVDARRAQITLDSTSPALTLITCYPFDATRADVSLRYVVSARALSVDIPARVSAAAY
ncbi:MAG: sortase [Pseudomonadota bacterium]